MTTTEKVQAIVEALREQLWEHEAGHGEYLHLCRHTSVINARVALPLAESLLEEVERYKTALEETETVLVSMLVEQWPIERLAARLHRLLAIARQALEGDLTVTHRHPSGETGTKE